MVIIGMEYQYDVIIIGGGPGGTKAAEVLASRGKKTAMIYKELGGECLNYGCIPTKIYLWAAELFEKASSAQKLGLNASGVRLNWEQMKKRKNEIVAKLKKNLRYTLEHSGAQLLEGAGELKDNHTVEYTTGGEKRLLTAENIILAMGADPAMPKEFKINDGVLSNREILDLPSVPKTLLIIGGGIIGVEFASVFCALGSQITISEKYNRILSSGDLDISQELEKILTRKNIKIIKNNLMSPAQTEEYEKTLVAIGRKPLLPLSALDRLGIKYSPKGIEINEHMQTNVPNVFVVGDLAGKALLAYTADREGETAARHILGEKCRPIRYDAIATTIFCNPEIASAGLPEHEAKARNIEYIAGKSFFSANSKALIADARDGFAKVIAEKKTGRIIGVHIIGEKASELAAEASQAVMSGLTLSDFYENIHSHPVLGETLIAACETAMKK